MGFKNIFWVEDNPEFIGQISLKIAEEFGISREDFFKRISWAYNLEDAKAMVGERTFDQYVLDFDFPPTMPADRVAYITDYLSRLQAGEKPEFDADYDTALKMAPGGFALIRNELSDSLDEVVISSASMFAQSAAAVFNIPFFAKGPREEDRMRKSLVQTANMVMTRDLADRYEIDHKTVVAQAETVRCGGTEEFLKYMFVD